MTFPEALEQKKSAIDRLIEEHLRKEEGYASLLIEAVNYSLRVGGKRIRPILLTEANRLFAGEVMPEAGTLAVALEMIHTYSLVHDDLPAMDNDALRRGHPTTHAKYGEAMGILAGDALLNEAVEVAFSAVLSAEDNERTCKAAAMLFNKAGIGGMVGGQSADVLAEKRNEFIEEEKLNFIYENKTQALIEASVMCGAMLAPKASKEDVRALGRAASCIGMAFQIRDDILDVTGDEKSLGKPIGSDERNGKSTYVTFAGEEGAKKRIRELTDEACGIVSRYTGEDDFLIELFRFLAIRDI